MNWVLSLNVYVYGIVGVGKDKVFAKHVGDKWTKGSILAMKEGKQNNNKIMTKVYVLRGKLLMNEESCEKAIIVIKMFATFIIIFWSFSTLNLFVSDIHSLTKKWFTVKLRINMTKQTRSRLFLSIAMTWPFFKEHWNKVFEVVKHEIEMF